MHYIFKITHPLPPKIFLDEHLTIPYNFDAECSVACVLFCEGVDMYTMQLNALSTQVT